MRQLEIILILICLISCGQEKKSNYKHETFDNLSLIKYSQNKFIHMAFPSEIFRISNDNKLIIETYKFLIKEDSFKVIPALYSFQLENTLIDTLNNLLKGSIFYKSDVNFNQSVNCDYALKIKLKNQVIRFERIDSNIIDNKTKKIFKFISSLIDTSKMIKIDYFKYFKEKGSDLPPFPFDKFKKIQLE